MMIQNHQEAATSKLIKKQDALHRMLHPRSIAVVGASPEPFSAGGITLQNLDAFDYTDELYMVNPKRTEINGCPCYASVEQLPDSIDVAVLAISFAAILPTVKQLVAKQIGAIVIYASGFAELNEEGRKLQEELSAFAVENNVLIVGPNCLGYTNYKNEIPLTFAPWDGGYFIHNTKKVAVISQSGGTMESITLACKSKSLSISYAVSTGNEAVLGVEDYFEYCVNDEDTHVITIYAEKIRKPSEFLRIAALAREKNKPVLMLHPGRSDKAKEAALSHTGSIAGDYNLMSVLVKSEGVVLLDTLEELFDVMELLTRYGIPKLPTTAIATDSGAFKGIAIDYCDSIELELSEFTEKTFTDLRAILPYNVGISNPQDITAMGISNHSFYSDTASVMLSDSNTGSLFFAFQAGNATIRKIQVDTLIKALANSSKPVIVTFLGETYIDIDSEIEKLRKHNIAYFQSSTRAIRALKKINTCATQLENAKNKITFIPNPTKKAVLPTGTLTESEGKKILENSGIAIPAGGEVSTIKEGIVLANKIGYPVVIKVASAEITHKSDIGGVIVNIKDDQELLDAWKTLQMNVSAVFPYLVTTVLLEKMGSKGLELVLGAKRDDEWGVVIMAGLGGVWVEAIHDIQLMPADMNQEAIKKELLNLRTSKLLTGFRGTPPVDLDAIANAVLLLGQLMLNNPTIKEIDVNPLIAYKKGEGVLALDAVIVTG